MAEKRGVILTPCSSASGLVTAVDSTMLVSSSHPLLAPYPSSVFPFAFPPVPEPSHWAELSSSCVLAPCLPPKTRSSSCSSHVRCLIDLSKERDREKASWRVQQWPSLLHLPSALYSATHRCVCQSDPPPPVALSSCGKLRLSVRCRSFPRDRYRSHRTVLGVARRRPADGEESKERNLQKT